MRSVLIAVAVLCSCGDPPPKYQPPPLDIPVTVAPKAGGSCNCTPPCGACDSQIGVLFCESQRFELFACKGPKGCTTNVGTAWVNCDFSGNLNGDPCPRSQEGTGTCTVAAPDVLLRCTDGGFKATPCRGCFQDGGYNFCHF